MAGTDSTPLGMFSPEFVADPHGLAAGRRAVTAADYDADFRGLRTLDVVLT